MKKKLITLTLCLLVASATAMSGCAGGDPTNDGNTVPPGASPLTQMEAVAPETGNVPKVLDSFTDGTSNYYLLDAGYIKGVFISKLAETTYEGLPFSYTEESTVTSQITDSLTEAVSSTHTTSDTFGNKTSVAAEWEFEAGGAVC